MTTREELIKNGICDGACVLCIDEMADGSCGKIREEKTENKEIIIIEETYLIQAEIRHKLTREEYNVFKNLSKIDKNKFLSSGAYQDGYEETFPLGNSRKFKVVKK